MIELSVSENGTVTDKALVPNTYDALWSYTSLFGNVYIDAIRYNNTKPVSKDVVRKYRICFYELDGDKFLNERSDSFAFNKIESYDIQLTDPFVYLKNRQLNHTLKGTGPTSMLGMIGWIHSIDTQADRKRVKEFDQNAERVLSEAIQLSTVHVFQHQLTWASKCLIIYSGCKARLFQFIHRVFGRTTKT